jgi:type II secretory pathway component PulM
MTSTTADEVLGFQFRDKQIPVTRLTSVNRETAQLALESQVFQEWVRRCEQGKQEQRLEIHTVEIQNVDMFGKRYGGRT